MHPVTWFDQGWKETVTLQSYNIGHIFFTFPFLFLFTLIVEPQSKNSSKLFIASKQGFGLFSPERDQKWPLPLNLPRIKEGKKWTGLVCIALFSYMKHQHDNSEYRLNIYFFCKIVSLSNAKGVPVD